jgi:hypothetical protein
MQCETKNKVEFDLKDPTKHQEIPKDTKDIPLFSEKKTAPLLKIGIGSLSTIFFTYKAYKEIRKIYEENRQRPVEKDSRSKAKAEKKFSSEPALKEAPNKSKASRWRALGYSGCNWLRCFYLSLFIRFFLRAHSTGVRLSPIFDI